MGSMLVCRSVRVIYYCVFMYVWMGMYKVCMYVSTRICVGIRVCMHYISMCVCLRMCLYIIVCVCVYGFML